MTEHELSKLTGKNLRVDCTNGNVVTGLCSVFIQALDNEPEIPSIVLETSRGLIEITLPEIREVTEE